VSVTKTPKKVKVEWIERPYISIISKYTCPSCKAIYENFITTNVLRFRCNCGQELIVEQQED
jgi:hypothetical protein